MASSPFTLIAENEYGESVNLTSDLSEILCEYSGFDPPTSDLLSLSMYNMRGSAYIGSHLQNRAITLTINIFKNVTAWRTNLYKIFRCGHKVTLNYSTENGASVGSAIVGQTVLGGTVSRSIEGYVETVEVPQFDAPKGSIKEVMQVGIVCFEPCWKSPEIIRGHTFEAETLTSSSFSDWTKSGVTVSSDVATFDSTSDYIEYTIGTVGELINQHINMHASLVDIDAATFTVYAVCNGDFHDLYSWVVDDTESTVHYGGYTFDTETWSAYDSNATITIRVYATEITGGYAYMYSPLIISTGSWNSEITYNGDEPAGMRVTYAVTNGLTTNISLAIDDEIIDIDALVSNSLPNDSDYTQITIDTAKKTVTGINHDGETVNIIRLWKSGNSWVELGYGTHTVSVRLTAGSVHTQIATLTMSYNELYQGV